MEATPGDGPGSPVPTRPGAADGGRGGAASGGSPGPDTPRPAWLDARAYPFAPHHLGLEPGRLHYVDEGSGPPILFVHGQPTWSFMYRESIRALSPRYRCVAPDLIGFGLSDKPPGWGYRAPQHAACVARLVEHLGLRDLTLVVHDWGGPIGLSHALDHPDRVARVVLLNTWMWSMDREWGARLFSTALGSGGGRWATRRFDLFVRQFMKRALRHVDGGRHWERVAACYEGPFARPEDRTGCSIFPREVLAASGWLRGLWDRRARLAAKPALFVWGMRDLAFREATLQRLLSAFPRHRLERREGVGHFVAEELGAELAERIEAFIAETPVPSRSAR